MIDWTKPLKEHYEVYEVSPLTWKEIRQIPFKNGDISRNLDTDTLGSANFFLTEYVGECYVRTYLVVEQDGHEEKFVVGTHIIQSPANTFSGICNSITTKAYTPLIELKEKYPPLYYMLEKGGDVNAFVYRMMRNNMRCPMVRDAKIEAISKYDVVADANDTYLDFLKNILSQNELRMTLSPEGEVSIIKDVPYVARQTKWHYTTDENSIICPSISITKDMYEIPNVVEIYCSTEKGYSTIIKKNENPNSPTSIQARGREIVHRVTNPSLVGIPSEFELENYANKLLKQLSTITVELSYRHAYCPVNVGDSVIIDYPAAGIKNKKCMVKSQNIDLKPGGLVSEEAVYTVNTLEESI